MSIKTIPTTLKNLLITKMTYSTRILLTGIRSAMLISLKRLPPLNNKLGNRQYKLSLISLNNKRPKSVIELKHSNALKI